MAPRTLALALVGAYLLLRLLWPSPAGAGTYDVYSCRLPDGSPAPTHGWAPLVAGQTGQGLRPESRDTCATGGSLTASLPFGDLSLDGMAAWRFAAPADTSITALQIKRFAQVDQPVGSTGRDYVATVHDWPVWDSPTAYPPLDATDERCVGTPPSGSGSCTSLGTADGTDAGDYYARSGINVHAATIGLMCGLEAIWQNVCSSLTRGGSEVDIFASRISLEDPLAPTVAAPSANLVGGQVTVLAEATDRGGGLSSAALLVDGKPIAQTGACDAGPYVDPTPCPLRHTFSLVGVAGGATTGQVQVTDVSGNTTISPPFPLPRPTVSAPDLRPATPVAAPALPRFVRLKSWFAGKSQRTVRTLGYGEHAVIQGVLRTPEGAPVAGASLTVEQRTVGVASRISPARITTDRTGRFAYEIAGTASRVVEVSYQAPGDPAPTATVALTLRVRAGVSLRISPSRVHNGTTVTFSGRVGAQPGTRRALVTIYSLSGGARKRIPVETVRADSAGRFSYRYTFRYLEGPTTYRFVAVVPKQNGFPYLEGESRAATVRGRP